MLTDRQRSSFSPHHSLNHQIGAATIVVATILLFSITLIALFSATYLRQQQMIESNKNQAAQAFEAAEAGLEYGISYFSTNSSTITSAAVNGVLNYSLSTVTLANNAKFTVTYSTVITNNLTLINVSSTGINSNNTATRIISQMLSQFRSYPSGTLTSHGAVSLVGGSTITNNSTKTNITSGGAVTINNGGATYVNGTLSSQQGSYGSDVVQNSSTISAMTEPNFFSYVMGSSESSVQSGANFQYTNTASSGDYSSLLSGKTGVTVWINQTNGSTVTLGNGVTIGSATKPVLLLVTGNLSIANGVTFYGYIYATGTGNFAGGAKLYGGIATYGATAISNGVGAANYTAYSSLNIGTSVIGKVPGSWLDF